MSRSYRHSNICKMQNGKNMKKFANKKVRNTEDIPNGKAYKKCFESWDICDYKWIWTKQDAIREYEQAQQGINYTWLLNEFPTLESYLEYWRKCNRK